MDVPEIPFTPRQQQLLSAAVHVVARGGLRGLTHRAVDAEAGLPEGSTSAYMRTRVALLTRLTEYVTAQFAHDISDLTQRIEEHARVDGYVVQETVAMLRSWLGAPDLLLVRMELTIEGSRQVEVAEILQVQWLQLVQIVEHAMEATGKVHNPARARTLLAAIDGVLLRAVREKPEDRASFLRDSLELLMTSLVGKSTESTHPSVS
jgi:DNA-binding transcriptional regulator YbjK